MCARLSLDVCVALRVPSLLCVSLVLEVRSALPVLEGERVLSLCVYVYVLCVCVSADRHGGDVCLFDWGAVDA